MTKKTRAGNARAGLQTADDGKALLLAFTFCAVIIAFLAAFFERRAEDISQRCAGIGRAILRHGFLLFRHLARLERQPDPARGLVEARDHGIELVALAEALGA